MNMDFVIGLPCAIRKPDSSWVIAIISLCWRHFLLIKTAHLMVQYTQFYPEEIVLLYRVQLSIILDRGIQFTSQFWEAPRCNWHTRGFEYILPFTNWWPIKKDRFQVTTDMFWACPIDLADSQDNHLRQTTNESST